MIERSFRALIPGLFLMLTFWFSGCYTQLGTTREEYREEEYTATESDTTGDDYEQSYTDNYYEYDNGAPGYRYGFDYYYPTFAFGFSPYDSWYLRHAGWYYYDPFVCGTYYPTIYAGYPYWPHGGYYPHYRYRGFASGGGRGYGTTRTVGTTRGGGVVRGSGRDESGPSRAGSTGGSVSLPTGYKTSSGTRNNPPAGTPSAPRVSTGRKSSDGERAGTRVGGSGRGGNTRNGSREGSRSSQPRTYTPPPKEQGADRSGSGRSYSPPPSPPPQQSTPPSDGGRSSGASGGSRGGRGR